jgi:hypothetical protein
MLPIPQQQQEFSCCTDSHTHLNGAEAITCLRGHLQLFLNNILKPKIALISKFKNNKKKQSKKTKRPPQLAFDFSNSKCNFTILWMYIFFPH